MILDIFLMALKNLKRRKTKSWLTVLGVFIGIAAIVSLISLGNGLREAVVGEFESLGTNRLVILSGDAQIAGPPVLADSGKEKYLDEDLKNYVSRISGVESVSGAFGKVALIEGKDEFLSPIVNGLPEDSRTEEYVTEFSIDVTEGRFLARNDKKSVVLSESLKEKIDTGLNRKIEIFGEDYKIVGFFEPPSSIFPNDAIFMPIEEVRAASDARKGELSNIYVIYDSELEDTFMVERLEEKIRRFLRENEDEQSFQVRSFKEFLNLLDSILGIVNTILIGLALISILVGGIGIMNSMFTSVIERKKEIGIMKSIGARNSSILTIFIIESAVISLVGGIIGTILGILLSKAVESIAFSIMGSRLLQAIIFPENIVFAIAFSIVIGIVSGYFPARQAAKLKPVESLRD